MSTKIALLFVISVVLTATFGAYVAGPEGRSPDQSAPWTDRDNHWSDQSSPLTDQSSPPTDQSSTEAASMAPFESASAFGAYLVTARMQTAAGGATRLGAGGQLDTERALATASPRAVEAGQAGGDGGAAGAPAATGSTGGTGGSAGPERYSETNVQEQGIDEPDVLKTDGKHVYYSARAGEKHHRRGDEGPEERGDEGPEERGARTRVVDASPPGTADVAASIDHAGRLVLAGDHLVVLGEKLWGYDVSNPADPELVWTRNLRDRVETARLHNGTLFLVLASPVDPRDPCPIEPLEGSTVGCTDVYHPDRPVRVDLTYTALMLDPATGDVGDELSFVGSRGGTVYMSQDGLYVTYTEAEPRASVQLEFLLTDARPLLDDAVVSRLETVRGYDLSPRARSVEVDQIVQRWLQSLPEDRRETVRTTLQDRYESYVESRKRTLTTTHVVRIDTTGPGALSIGGTGAVPGRPLDQFSLDQHEGHLRIATTVGERWNTDSVNDVYVLDATNLSVTGSVTGMGETERIYAVRFVGDRGYVVTFRRVDPFHVLDLSAPSDPTLAGTLKLPGYSTYLHPLDGDRVLGIGEENGQVKAVIFDVSDPTNPTIEESRVLAADWSAISRTHHAFVLDKKHDVFFLPTERGGKVLSSATLDTVHTVAVDDPRRGLYIEDYLYVFGHDEVAVVDETNWTRTETLDL